MPFGDYRVSGLVLNPYVSRSLAEPQLFAFRLVKNTIGVAGLKIYRNVRRVLIRRIDIYPEPLHNSPFILPRLQVDIVEGFCGPKMINGP